MATGSLIDVSKYAHSPVHKAVATRDYVALRRIIGALPRFCDPSEIQNKSVSISEEEKAVAKSGVIDRRDVPNRETPLHLAVKLGDTIATEILMAAGADWSLQNEQGWSPLQEAACAREEAISQIIVGKVPPGSLCMISHKDMEVMNALDGAGAQASDSEVAQEVAAMSQTIF